MANLCVVWSDYSSDVLEHLNHIRKASRMHHFTCTIQKNSNKAVCSSLLTEINNNARHASAQ